MEAGERRRRSEQHSDKAQMTGGGSAGYEPHFCLSVRPRRIYPEAHLYSRGYCSLSATQADSHPCTRPHTKWVRRRCSASLIGGRQVDPEVNLNRKTFYDVYCQLCCVVKGFRWLTQVGCKLGRMTSKYDF